MLKDMCGRYAASKDLKALREIFDAEAVPDQELPPDYNIAPTKRVNAVIERVDDAGRHRGIEIMKWGLVPSWAKEPSIGARMINARVETVTDKPAFRKAFAKRRALLPADGYYEWHEPHEGSVGTSGKPLKQPYYIHPSDGSVLAMAALWEAWRDPTRDNDDPAAWLITATVITTSARDEVGRIHDRMPLVVGKQHWSTWLDPTRPGDSRLLDVLVPAAAAGLVAYPVSTAVNSVRNNGPELLAPLPADRISSEQTLF